VHFEASVLTVCVEEGYIVAAVPVPNDGHELICTVMAALYRGGLPADFIDDAYHALVYEMVTLGGPLGSFPVLIATDHVAKHVNLWERCAAGIVQGCLEHGVRIPIPVGAVLVAR
jgi:hypothetical protein